MKYQEIEGNLIERAFNGEFDVVCHGANCMSNMGSGIAPQMAKAFGCDKFEMETWGRTIEKLGCIDYETFVLGSHSIWSLMVAENSLNEPELTVINAYTQYSYGKNHLDGSNKPLDYEALTLCLRKINVRFKGKHIGLPLIGCGLGGGVWDYTLDKTLTGEEVSLYVNKQKKDVKTIIQQELKDCNVTIVHYKQ